MKIILTSILVAFFSLQTFCQDKQRKFTHAIGTSVMFESNEGTIGPAVKYNINSVASDRFWIGASAIFYQNLDIKNRSESLNNEPSPIGYHYYTSAFIDFGITYFPLKLENGRKFGINTGLTYQYGLSQFPSSISYNSPTGWNDWNYENTDINTTGYHIKLVFVPQFKNTINVGYEVATHTSFENDRFAEFLSFGVNLYLGKSR